MSCEEEAQAKLDEIQALTRRPLRMRIVWLLGEVERLRQAVVDARNALGQEAICGCHTDHCGLADEAHEALQVLKDVMDGDVNA